MAAAPAFPGRQVNLIEVLSEGGVDAGKHLRGQIVRYSPRGQQRPRNPNQTSATAIKRSWSRSPQDGTAGQSIYSHPSGKEPGHPAWDTSRGEAGGCLEDPPSPSAAAPMSLDIHGPEALPEAPALC